MRKEDAQILIEMVEKSLKQSREDSQLKFDQSHKLALNDIGICFPRILRIFQKYYLLRLKLYLFASKFFKQTESDSNEKISQLEFGILYGCLANEMQRHWCIELFSRLKVDRADRALLVFSKIINVRTFEVRFGRWDRFAGMFSFSLIALMILYSLCIILCVCSSIELKLFSFFFNSPIILFSIFWHKTMIVDAHKIGRKYFEINGWSSTPIFKT